MKLIRADKERFVFSLGKKEQQLLFQVMEMYPLVPPTHHRLGRKGAASPSAEDQQLLEEAVAEQRRENRKQVEALLQEPGKFSSTKRGLQFFLTPLELESLLQVLNDVRVGAWLALGEPDEDKPPEIDESNLVYLMAMEASGYFQSELLAALGLDLTPPEEGIA